MEDVFLLPTAKVPVIFKMKTAGALEFHILFFVFHRICPDSTITVPLDKIGLFRNRYAKNHKTSIMTYTKSGYIGGK